MDLGKITKEELVEESKKKVKSTGKYTSKAIEAQRILWDEYHWGERSIIIEDNGIIDYNMDAVYYDGTVEENKLHEPLLWDEI